MAIKRERTTETANAPANNRGSLIGFMELNVEFNGVDKETQETIVVLKKLLRDMPMYDSDKIMQKMVEIVEANPREFTLKAKVKPYKAKAEDDNLDELS